MMTQISMADDADSWCRQLGNFAPIVYRSEAQPTAAMPFGGAVFESGEDAMPAAMRSQRGGAIGHFLLALLIAATMAWPLSGSAQMQGGGMGGHGGGHGNRGNRPADSAQKNSDAAAAHTPNPMRAMLDEMRKLRADLLLTSTQIGPWSAMEDALRDCVELNRSRMPVVQAGTAIDAQIYAQDLADNQRALSEAMDKFSTATKAAFAVLNPRQLQTSKSRLASAITGDQQN